MKLDELLKLIYSDKDVSRIVSTFIAAVTVLFTYTMLTQDWIIIGTVGVIGFTLSRMVSIYFYARWSKLSQHKSNALKQQEIFESLSEKEKNILEFFRSHGSLTATYKDLDETGYDVTRAGVNSLIQRGFITDGLMEDHVTKCFVIDEDIFKMANELLPEPF